MSKHRVYEIMSADQPTDRWAVKVQILKIQVTCQEIKLRKVFRYPQEKVVHA